MRLLLVFSAIASMLAADVAFAQSGVDFWDRFEGRYSGTLHRSVTASIGSPPSASDGAPATREEQDPRQLMRNTEAALRDHKRDQPIPIQFLVSFANDHWSVELRFADDQLGAPLPSVAVMNIPKAPATLSPVRVDGLPIGQWTARATLSRESLIVYFIELNALSTPAQIQMSLQPAERGISLVLWRIDSDGRRASGWTSMLSRQ